MCQHAADISPPTRAFNTAKHWTYLLFDEFFQQGDQEKFENLQVSFLCDRETTNVAQSQPGFLNFIVIPLFKALAEAIPAVQDCVDSAEMNVASWSTYDESEEERKCYKNQKSVEKMKLKKNLSIVSQGSLVNNDGSKRESNASSIKIQNEMIEEERDDSHSNSSFEEEKK